MRSRNSSVTSIKKTQIQKNWNENSMKKPQLLLSDVIQQYLNDLDHISVVVLLYDEMRLL